MIVKILIIFFGFVLLLLFILLKLTGVPKEVYKEKTVYTDHATKPVKAFFSKKYGLTGKPDFILKTKDGLLPLEIKHSEKPKQPYFSHVMQLISYCLLMEESGNRPRYGFIRYKGGKAFSIPYTENMKSSLLKTMQEMRDYLDSGEGPEPIRKYRCEKCSYQSECFKP